MKESKTMKQPAERTLRVRNTFRNAWRMRALYVMLILPIAFIAIFAYKPMYGLVMAFQDFKLGKGIAGSEWIGFGHFVKLFKDPLFGRAMRNTLNISLWSILVTFPAPIIFALLLNEIRNEKFKKFVQTVTSVPNFISWVIVGSIAYQVLSPENGLINIVRQWFGMEPVYFLGKAEYFVTILTGSHIWKGVGWSSIIYLASMTAIDPGLYESAELDGASRFQKMLYITIPCITPVIVIQFIMRIGQILTNSLDPVLVLSNPQTFEASYTLEYFAYNVGLLSNNFDYGAAIGLFQNVLGLILVLFTNWFSKKVSEYGLW